MGDMQVQKALLGELEKSFRHGDSDRRGEIVRKIGHLFVSGAEKYSVEQVELFGEVLTRLVEEISEAVRAELSHSLCSAPVAPSKLLRRLALDCAIEVAEPMLADFASLDESIQVECASSCGQSHLMALTRRPALSAVVTAPLVSRGDPAVLKSVVKNDGAVFSENSYGTLVERSHGDDELVLAIGARSDLPRHHFLRLLQVASDFVRINLQAADPQNAGTIRKIVSQASIGIAAKTIASSDGYDEALTNVQALYVTDKLSDEVVLSFAKQEKLEFAVVALALLSSQEIVDVEAAIRQERPEALMILTRAIGLSWQTAKALLNVQASINRLSLLQIEQALAVFERTDRATAKKVLEIKRRSKTSNKMASSSV